MNAASFRIGVQHATAGRRPKGFGGQPLTGTQHFRAPLLEQFASDAVLRRAYRWICQPRGDAAPHDDVFAIWSAEDAVVLKAVALVLACPPPGVLSRNTFHGRLGRACADPLETSCRDPASQSSAVRIAIGKAPRQDDRPADRPRFRLLGVSV